jgi:hypothetical protein
MQNYERTFIRTSDGLTTLPNPDILYDKSAPYDYKTCVTLMDTNQEYKIKLGTKYKEPAMAEGQCWISKFLANKTNS